MQVELMPVGTVVLYKGNKYVILGYTWGEFEGKLVMQYIACPFLQGYMKQGIVLLLKANEFDVVKLGYRDERFVYLEKYYTTINSVADNVSATDMRQYLNEAYNINRLRGVV